MKTFLMGIFLNYIRILAKLQLLKNKPLIIGLTGSAGKTSALNAIEAVLKDLPGKKIKISHKANSEVGLPLNILDITVRDFSIKSWVKISFLALWKLLTNWQKIDIYVAEMGIDSPYPPKNMDYLLSFLNPKIGIFLNASAVHSETFDHLVKEEDLKKKAKEIIHLIALEKGKLISSLPEEGIAILNIDDEEVAACSDKAKVISISSGAGDITLKSHSPSISGTNFVFSYQDKDYQANFKGFVLPKKFGFSLATAIAVGLSINMEIGEIIGKLEQNLIIPPGRSTLLQGISGSYILDSSYNSSLEPAVEMVELLDNIAKGRKIAILGDMREMGDEAGEAHQKLIKEALNKTDLLLLVGPLMEMYASKNEKIHLFNSAQQAAKFLKPQILKDDCILIKASQNTLLLEIAAEQLLQNPTDSSKLCRRGAFWNKQRNKLIS
jgi:UDP-N-acetylmuramoyl-tripeptide--D-alanyl-D-alanine ligase